MLEAWSSISVIARSRAMTQVGDDQMVRKTATHSYPLSERFEDFAWKKKECPMMSDRWKMMTTTCGPIKWYEGITIEVLQGTVLVPCLRQCEYGARLYRQKC